MPVIHAPSPVRRNALIARLSKAGTQRLYRAKLHAHYNALEAVQGDIRELISMTIGMALHTHLSNVLLQYHKLLQQMRPFINQSEDYSVADRDAIDVLLTHCAGVISMAEAPLIAHHNAVLAQRNES